MNCLSNNSLLQALVALLLLCPTISHATIPETKKCLYVSSYHVGYEWSDDIESSIRTVLDGHCDLLQVDMDSKRNSSPEQIFKITNKIVKLIEDWQPDVVITSDDNAAKYLIAPHYRDDKVPFVFCGVNWTVEEYGFPYTNVTGIVEVAPVRIMLEEAFKVSGQGRKAVFIGADRLSEKKNFDRLKVVAEELNIQIDAVYTSSFRQWKRAMGTADEYDITIIGTNAGISNWDADEAMQTALKLTRTLTVTNDRWMLPYSSFGYTKIAKEQGEWAATVAISILNGVQPDEVPLASNKKWDLWINQAMLNNLNIHTGRALLKKAKRLKIATSEE